MSAFVQNVASDPKHCWCTVFRKTNISITYECCRCKDLVSIKYENIECPNFPEYECLGRVLINVS